MSNEMLLILLQCDSVEMSAIQHKNEHLNEPTNNLGRYIVSQPNKATTNNGK